MSRNSLPSFVLSVLLGALTAAPVSAETFTHRDEQSFTVPSGGAIRLDLSIHDVELRVREGSTVRVLVDMEVSGSENKAREYLEGNIPRMGIEGDDLVIRAEAPGKKSWWSGGWGGLRSKARVEVELPPGVDVDLNTASGDLSLDGELGDGVLDANTASGDITLRGGGARIRLNTASGDIRLDPAGRVESLSANTASGDIHAAGNFGKVSLNTASGDIEAEGLQGDATLNTASGDISARWNAVRSGLRISADAASGDVRLTLPRDAALSGEVSCLSGDITVDFPGRYVDGKRGFRFSAEDGDETVTLSVDTASGDVTVSAR